MGTVGAVLFFGGLAGMSFALKRVHTKKLNFIVSLLGILGTITGFILIIISARSVNR